MQTHEFKQIVITIVGTEIKFDGHLEKIIDNLPEDRQTRILNWITQCKEGTIRPEPCKNIPNALAFIYKSNDNQIRGILTKEKNSYFIELFLDKHKYYDRKRKYLGL